jgi:mono/diheme cytochrome c family protein
MADQKLHGISAYFNKPDDLISAAKKINEAGYTEWDAHTPYPMHGLDAAMGAKDSKVPYLTLGLATVAFLAIMLFTWWTSVVDYPLNIGGKAFFPFLSYIPIIFVVVVLVSVVGTIAGTIILFFKLPGQGHPLLHTEYARATSCDRLGVVLESTGSYFDPEAAKKLLAELGGVEISEIYEPEKEVAGFNLPFGIFIPWQETFFIGFLATVVIGVGGKTYVVFNKVLEDRIPFLHEPEPLTGMILEDFTGIPIKDAPFNTLLAQNREKVTAKSLFFEDGRSIRSAVEGTVARGFMPYPYKGQPAVAAAKLVNPLAMDEETIKEGRKLYNINCSMCHGYFGDGDDRLNGNFPAAPSLHNSKIKSSSDGLIYHIITDGQGTMPKYDKQLTRSERWTVVNFVRSLQRARDAKASDLK